MNNENREIQRPDNPIPEPLLGRPRFHMPVLEKHILPNDSQSPTVEVPPAYESLSPSRTDQTTTRLIDNHTPITHTSAIFNPTGSPPPPFRGIGPTQKSHTRSPSSSLVASAKGKKSGWFSFSSSASSKTPHEVRSTVLGLVRDLVQDHSSGSPAALGILQSCADACTSHSVSFSVILQEKFIENHTPLYWAIVKRTKGPLEDDEGGGGLETKDDLVTSLLSHISPLNPDTILDLRMACMATSDQVMFQRLRRSPIFASISGSDQILMGGSPSPDDVTVEFGPGDKGAFTVDCVVPQFHKRMMVSVSKEIVLDFIARNRLWRLSFMIIPDDVWYGPPPGSWCASLSLLEPSPPTWFNSRLYIREPGGETVSHTNSSGTEHQPQPIDLLSPTPTLGHTFSSQIPPLPAHLKKHNALILNSTQMLEAPRNGIPATKIVVSMDDSPAFASLQYSGSSFLGADETLRIRLEAELIKSN